jgi:hypothetical protein
MHQVIPIRARIARAVLDYPGCLDMSSLHACRGALVSEGLSSDCKDKDVHVTFELPSAFAFVVELDGTIVGDES